MVAPSLLDDLHVIARCEHPPIFVSNMDRSGRAWCVACGAVRNGHQYQWMVPRVVFDVRALVQAIVDAQNAKSSDEVEL